MLPILIVDDEPAIAALISRVLTAAGYTCQAVTSSEKAADLIEQNRYDLVLLDVMMPKIDGYDLLEYIRPTGTPSIFVTAKDAVSERVRGLHSGADDYIVKPFAPAELTARVEAVLRRTGRATVQYSLWGCTVDTAACRVTSAGQEIKLTAKEFDILEYLMQNQGRVLSRDKLSNHIWNYDYDGGSNVIDVYMYHLRRKIDRDFDEKKIQTVKGAGYMIK